MDFDELAGDCLYSLRYLGMVAVPGALSVINITFTAYQTHGSLCFVPRCVLLLCQIKFCPWQNLEGVDMTLGCNGLQRRLLGPQRSNISPRVEGGSVGEAWDLSPSLPSPLPPR
jgi:hypothetical protein